MTHPSHPCVIIPHGCQLEDTVKTAEPNTDLVSSPVEIAENTWWVGKREPSSIFYANPYLRVFPKRSANQKRTFNLLIDPGSAKELAVVRAKVERVIGNINQTTAVFVNHQDPDVGSAAGLLIGRYAPQCHVLCSEDTWRLISYYNIPRDRYVSIERYPSGFRLPNDERIIPVPSPFCHFVGAVMLYDPQSRVLFSGDLFGGLTDKDAQGLYADEGDWKGIRAFHQIYMPTNKALRYAITQIQALEPTPQIIAPQHGRVIRGQYVDYYLERLMRLGVGLDLLEDRTTSQEVLQAWSTVLERIVCLARELISPEVVALLEDDPDLIEFISIEGGQVRILRRGKTAVERVVRLLTAGLSSELADPIRYEAVIAAGDLQLATPSIELEEGGFEGGAVEGGLEWPDEPALRARRSLSGADLEG